MQRNKKKGSKKRKRKKNQFLFNLHRKGRRNHLAKKIVYTLNVGGRKMRKFSYRNEMNNLSLNADEEGGKKKKIVQGGGGGNKK